MGFIDDLFSGDRGAGFTAAPSPIANPITQQQINQAGTQVQTGLTNQNNFVQALQGQQGVANQGAALRNQQGLQTQLAGQQGVANQSAALGAQRNLAGALAANQGAQNMGDVYGRQAAFVNALNGQGGLNNQSQVFNQQAALQAQQQGLVGQLQGVADGTGPNPAMAALNQQTSNNISQQAALMASQRGAGANAGLLARQAGMQGANIQQQAAGQAATLQAQQQLAGLGAIGQQQQAIGNTQQAMGQTAANQVANQGAQQAQLANIAANQVAQQANQQAAVANLATQQVGQQMQQNQAVGNMATNQVSQQQNALNSYNQAAQGSQQNYLNAASNFNNALVSQQNGINGVNGQMAQGNQGFQSNLIGGLMSGASSGIMAMLAKGGVVEKPQRMADGGVAGVDAETFPAPESSPIVVNVSTDPNAPVSATGRFLFGTPSNNNAADAASSLLVQQPVMAGNAAAQAQSAQSGQKGGKGMGDMVTKLLGGSGQIPGGTGLQKPQMGSQFNTAGPSLMGNGQQHVNGNSLMSPSDPPLVFNKGGAVNSKELIAKKKPVPGKAKVKGDSYANDTVKAQLSPGEVVLPRSVMQSKDPVQAAAAFVQALVAKQNMRKPAK